MSGPDRVPPSVRSWLLFERYTLIGPDEMRLRRSRWPAWRRAIHPLDAALFWLVVLSVFLPHGTGPNRSDEVFGVQLTMVCLVAACVVVGTGLEWRDRRREGLPMLGWSRRINRTVSRSGIEKHPGPVAP
jgi:peptidoglycan/LPS O-acetylase OafA/YrhL